MPEEKETLAVGDTVRLKSGGPPMTIQDIASDMSICVWFDAKGIRQQAQFLTATLQAENGSYG